MTKGVITVDPPEAEIGDPVSIRLSAFPPEHPVTVRATTVGLAYPDLEDTGTVRESSATFQTDASGTVDLAEDAPISGSYAVANPMGLFWSMTEVQAASEPTSASPPPDSANPAVFLQYRTELTAEVDGAPVATAVLDQDLGSPDVTMTEISENGVLGQFYLPPGAGPFPAVIVLSGSSGGLTVRRPKVFASQGYAVLSLPYFNYTSPVDGTALPSTAVELPLEYFGKAIDWLQAQPSVDPDRIGIYGTSLGGQVAMLVGARYPEIKSVIAIAPPTVTWDDGAGKSSFSFEGKPVPFATTIGVEAAAQPFRDAVAAGQDFRATIPGIVANAKADPETAAAIIPVEKIKGSVLVVSGTNDTQLPSVVYGELSMDRLREHDFAFPYRHVIGEGAGHLIDVPYVDRSTEISEGGGSPEANELAGEAMWPLVLEDLAAMK
ncbi:MAG TPA: acyl-CoA thioesterase/bile acid-CoA:amino acid N-acyltransferase family protein [Candidatus Limnocylindrales bacterium]